MGVPITFLDKYNPDQFEILGDSRWGIDPNFPTKSPNDAKVHGRTPYRRILIRNKQL